MSVQLRPPALRYAQCKLIYPCHTLCILLNGRNNYLYTGITWSLDKRLTEHKNGKVPNTKSNLPIELVYKEEFKTRLEAARREKKIKGWRHDKKERLF